MISLWVQEAKSTVDVMNGGRNTRVGTQEVQKFNLVWTGEGGGIHTVKTPETGQRARVAARCVSDTFDGTGCLIVFECFQENHD